MTTLIVGFTDAEFRAAYREDRALRIGMADGDSLLDHLHDYLRSPITEWLRQNLTDQVVGPDEYECLSSLTRATANTFDFGFRFTVTFASEADACAFAMVFGDRIVTP